MKLISFKRNRFPPDLIWHAVWLYFPFTPIFRDVEHLLAERGFDVSYETIRFWTLKFGPLVARNLRERRPKPSGIWHLDEMVVRIRGVRMYMWRAVDNEGEVLGVLVQKRRNKAIALKLLRNLLKNSQIKPERIVIDKLYSYSSARRELGMRHKHEPGGAKEAATSQLAEIGICSNY